MNLHRPPASRRRLRVFAGWPSLVVLALAGCTATVPPAPPGATANPALPAPFARLPQVQSLPAGQATARFLLRSSVPGSQQAVLVQLADHDNCKTPQLAAVAPRTGEAPASATLAAGKPVTLDFVVADGARIVCGTRWAFTPASGKQYLVQGTTLGSLCMATLTDVSQADRPRTPDDLRYRTEAGKACVPMDQARRVPPGLLEGGQVDGEAVLRPTATQEPLKGLIKP